MNKFQKKACTFLLSSVFAATLTWSPSLHALRAEEGSSTSASDAVSPSEGASSQANSDYEEGFRSFGSDVKSGANAVGRAFKKAGVAIKNYFAGTSSSEGRSVEERDLGSSPSSPVDMKDINYNSQLDAIGNSPKAQSMHKTDLESDARL